MIPERPLETSMSPSRLVFGDVLAESKGVRSKPAINLLLIQLNHPLEPVLPGFNYLPLGKVV